MTFNQKMVRSVAAVAVIGAVASISIVGGSANADPQYTTGLVGVGSDTTQDVTNALAGFAPTPSGGIVANGRFVPAIASNGQQLVSFDATNPDPVSTDTCITSRPGGPLFQRPNGSTNGRAALSRASTAPSLTNRWGSTACGGLKDISGQFDFARSSSGPSSGDTGTDLTYSVLGRDAVSLAFYRTGVATSTIDPVASASAQLKTRWTRAELTALYTNTSAAGGIQVVTADDGSTPVNVLPCAIQAGSGTQRFVLTAFGLNAGQETAATSVCEALGGTGRLQENDSTALKAKGDLAPPNTQVVVGFSVGAFVGKSNGVAGPNPQTDQVGVAAITNAVATGTAVPLGLGYSGTAPNLTPSSTFYSGVNFGRTIYNVIPTARIDSLFGNDGLKSMFKDPDLTTTTNGPLQAAICTQPATIERFGFLVSANCGSTLLKGSFIAGTTNV